MPRPPLARERVLDAFETILIDDGERAATLDAVARRAEVSKGGLLYHFPNKETLLNGVATNLMTQFRSHVEQAATAEPEGVPGRLTRAYIRVSFAHAGDPNGLRDYIALAAHLMFEPALEELAQADAAQWRSALFEDGLDPAITRMVIAATDGSNSAPLWGAVLTEPDRTALEADLIALTQRDDSSG